ncbi:MAG: hypothetical protein WBG42_07135 [Cryomorphaceae bacterium]
MDIHVSKSYIQLAKDRLRHLKFLLDEGDVDIDIHFALASVITNYSFAAIEAFANKALYDDWVYAKYRFSEQFNDPYVKPHNQKKLEEFYEKYGEWELFKEIKNSDIRELKDRLRLLCDLSDIPRISDDTKKLWGDFNNLLRESRHFLIHIDSTTEVFHEKTKEILEIKNLEKYTQIASSIIAYYYVKKGKRYPQWLI